MATTNRLFDDQPATGAALLRVVFGNRLGHRVLRVSAGASRTMEFAVVVILAEILLPAGDVLRDDQISGDGDSWASCWVGETRAKSDRGGRTLEGY